MCFKKNGIIYEHPWTATKMKVSSQADQISAMTFAHTIRNDPVFSIGNFERVDIVTDYTRLHHIWIFPAVFR